MVDSFLPIAHGVSSGLASAALLVTTVAATFARWQAGRHGDRYGHARLLVPALAAAALGMAALLADFPGAAASRLVVFGAAFGVVENATFALLLDRLPEATASSLWNLAYDAGYGAGPAVFGLFAARTGYPPAFALTGVLVLAVFPLALRERRPGDRSARDSSSQANWVRYRSATGRAAAASVITARSFPGRMPRLMTSRSSSGFATVISASSAVSSRKAVRASR